MNKLPSKQPSRLWQWNTPTASLQRGKTSPPVHVLDMTDIKPCDGKAPALEIRGMWSTPSLPLLPGPF